MNTLFNKVFGGICLEFSQVDDPIIADINMHDFPAFCDAFLVSGEYNGRQLTELELDWINDNEYDFIREYIHLNQLYM